MSAAAQRAYVARGMAAAREAVRSLFERKVMLADAKELKRQLAAGVCERIGGPVEVLAMGPAHTPPG